jgi:hypothetical protein
MIPELGHFALILALLLSLVLGTLPIVGAARRVPAWTGLARPVAQGQIGSDGVFHASEVLAKHDENYMPPEAADAVQRAHDTNRKAAQTVVGGGQR